MNASARQSKRITATHRSLGGPEWLILIGADVFIFILWLSAVFDASIRWLHFFQAWMYIAALVLSLHRNRWGYFIGVSIAAFWDYNNLFVTSFLRSGLIHLWQSIHSGHLSRPDQIIAVPAWTGNLLLIIGCAWGYTRLANKSRGDVLRFPLAFALMTGLFALIIAMFQPRYLPMFRHVLHPHAPW